MKAIRSWGVGLIVEGLIFFALLSLLANLSRIPSVFMIPLSLKNDMDSIE